MPAQGIALFYTIIKVDNLDELYMKKDFYDPKSHKGTQPVRVFEPMFLNWLAHLDPEFKKELIKISEDVGLNRDVNYFMNESPLISEDNNYEIQTPYIDINKKMTFHETFLSYLWAISYGISVMYIEGYEKPILEERFVGIIDLQNEEAKKARKLFAHGLSLITEFKPWDKAVLPNPESYFEDNAFYIERNNSIFLYAFSFIMMHEYSHVILGHIDSRKGNNYYPKYQMIDDEIAADQSASELLLRFRTSESRKISIELGMVVGICSLLFLNNKLTSATHPDKDERIKRVLESLELEDIDPLWHIASFAIGLWCNIYKIPLDLPTNLFETGRDLFDNMITHLDSIKH